MYLNLWCYHVLPLTSCRMLRCQFVASESDRRSFMEFALKALLYQPPASLRQTPALQQGAQAPGARPPGQQGGAQVTPMPWLLLRSRLSCCQASLQRSQQSAPDERLPGEY